MCSRETLSPEATAGRGVSNGVHQQQQQQQQQRGRSHDSKSSSSMMSTSNQKTSQRATSIPDPAGASSLKTTPSTTTTHNNSNQEQDSTRRPSLPPSSRRQPSSTTLSALLEPFNPSSSIDHESGRIRIPSTSRAGADIAEQKTASGVGLLESWKYLPFLAHQGESFRFYSQSDMYALCTGWTVIDGSLRQRRETHCSLLTNLFFYLFTISLASCVHFYPTYCATSLIFMRHPRRSYCLPESGNHPSIITR